MAVLGFDSVGSGLLTLLVLVLWVGFWFVGPIITFIGVAMAGGGGTKGGQGQILYTTVFLAFALAGGTGIWFLTRGDWPLRIVFLVAPAGGWFWMTGMLKKDAAAKHEKAEAIYAQAKARDGAGRASAQAQEGADAAPRAPDNGDPAAVIAADTSLTDLLMGNTKGKPPQGPDAAPSSQP